MGQACHAQNWRVHPEMRVDGHCMEFRAPLGMVLDHAPRFAFCCVCADGDSHKTSTELSEAEVRMRHDGIRLTAMLGLQAGCLRLDDERFLGKRKCTTNILWTAPWNN